MKQCVLTLLYFSFVFTSIAQPDLEKVLLEKLEAATHDSLKPAILIDLHNAVFKTDLLKAKHYASQIIETGIKLGSNFWKQKGYIGMARCERKLRNYEEVHKLNEYSIDLARNIGDAPNLFSALLIQARDYLDNDKPAKAYRYLEECRKLQEGLEKSYQAKLEQTVGYYYSKLNRYKESNEAYKKSADAYNQLGDKRMVAENKYLTSLNLLSLRETHKIPEIIYAALDTYKEINSMGRQADCYAVLGQAYIINGNGKKGVEVFEQVLNIYKQAQDRVNEGLTYIDLARCYLLQLNRPKAFYYAQLAEQIFDKVPFEYGIVKINTFWGQYYSAKADYNRADKKFLLANKLAAGEDLQEPKIENEKYWAQSKYNRGKFSEGDSLFFSYMDQLLKHANKTTVQNELQILLARNKHLRPADVKMLKQLYSSGGVQQLKETLGDRTLMDYIRIDSVLNLNPFSLATPGYDSGVLVADNTFLIEQETKYKNKLISDSLRTEQKNGLLARAEIKRRNIIVASIAAIAIILAFAFWLQLKNRKRAEKDKAKIKVLQDEIHHRVNNNLGVIMRLIDVAGKNATDKSSLEDLQTRVTAIALVHKRLYKDDLVGKISLFDYLDDLTSAIQNTFDPLQKIDVAVKSKESIDGKTAEKIGLITNEVVTNSYKYAFDGKTDGSIAISVDKTTDGLYKLKISDNGKGIDMRPDTGYGMKIIAGLTHELRGKHEFKVHNGTHFTLTFSDNN